MYVKKCEFCNKYIKTKIERKRFCNNICQRKHYNSKPEIKKINRIRTREYRRNHPEWRERHRILAITKHRKKRAEYWKDYAKRPEVKKRIRGKEMWRRRTDLEFAVRDRLRRSLHHALTKYTKTGKIMSSRKYGIDWKEVIKSLNPFPKNISDYEIDHIIPLRTFKLTNPNEVKKAFNPSNLQWLTIEENRKKSGKVIQE
ncbi:hypothetical protein J4426_00985 [Candidatus Woesearchaeota archaeon]|nr:hypothetical protein [Candidatus Woesearchaeota archaeon]